MSTMRFCRECNNILYPRENKELKSLVYACRNCDRTEPALNNCVYRNEIRTSAQTTEELTQVIMDISSDPTLPRTRDVRCVKCGNNEAVFFQSTTRGDADAMALFYLCCNANCAHRWRD